VICSGVTPDSIKSVVDGRFAMLRSKASNVSSPANGSTCPHHGDRQMSLEHPRLTCLLYKSIARSQYNHGT
jgi:hypothetical protein